MFFKSNLTVSADTGISGWFTFSELADAAGLTPAVRLLIFQLLPLVSAPFFPFFFCINLTFLLIYFIFVGFFILSVFFSSFMEVCSMHF